MSKFNEAISWIFDRCTEIGKSFDSAFKGIWEAFVAVLGVIAVGFVGVFGVVLAIVINLLPVALLVFVVVWVLRAMGVIQ